MRWWILLAVTLLAMAIVHGQPRGYDLAIGRVTATDQEAQECYFHIADAYVILHPRGLPCVRMREFVGQTGVLSFIPDQ